MAQGGWVYITTSKSNTVLYTGVTANLLRRMWEHVNRVSPGSFVSRYHGDKLVYYRRFESIEAAITEEKRIKGGSRAKKLALIQAMNPDWNDLYLDYLAGK